MWYIQGTSKDYLPCFSFANLPNQSESESEDEGSFEGYDSGRRGGDGGDHQDDNDQLRAERFKAVPLKTKLDNIKGLNIKKQSLRTKLESKSTYTNEYVRQHALV